MTPCWSPTIHGHSQIETEVPVRSPIGFSPNGKRFWAVLDNMLGKVQLIDSQTGKRANTLNLPGNDVLSVALSPDEKRMAAGTEDGKIYVVSLDEDNKVTELPLSHNEGIRTLAFSPTGKYLASGSLDKSVHLWQQTESGYEHLMTLDGFTAPLKKNPLWSLPQPTLFGHLRARSTRRAYLGSGSLQHVSGRSQAVVSLTHRREKRRLTQCPIRRAICDS